VICQSVIEAPLFSLAIYGGDVLFSPLPQSYQEDKPMEFWESIEIS